MVAIQRADLPDGLAFGGVDEDVFAVEREEVGALPHLAGSDGVGACLAVPLALAPGGAGIPSGESRTTCRAAHVPPTPRSPEATMTGFQVIARRGLRQGEGSRKPVTFMPAGGAGMTGCGSLRQWSSASSSATAMQTDSRRGGCAVARVWPDRACEFRTPV